MHLGNFWSDDVDDFKSNIYNFYSTFTHPEENENKLILMRLNFLKVLQIMLQNKLAPYQGYFCQNVIDWSVRFTPGLCVPRYIHKFSVLRTNQVKLRLIFPRFPITSITGGKKVSHFSGRTVNIHLRGKRNQKTLAPREWETVLMSFSTTSNSMCTALHFTE